MSDDDEKKILFVGRQRDRFAHAQAALKESGKWRSIVVGTPNEAIQALTGKDHFAAVIADTKENAEVILAKVRAVQPSAARFALGTVRPTIHTPRGGMRALDKVARGADVREALDHACAFQELVWAEPVTKLVGDVRQLPSVPGAYWDFVDAVRRNASLADIGAIVERDPAMSLKVLQLVNSAFFGVAQRTTSIQRAVSLLGTNRLRALLLSAHVFSAFGEGAQGFSPEQFQRYAVRVGRLAQEIGAPLGVADDAFTAGILLDVGKLVLAVRRPAEFDDVLTKSFEQGVAAHIVERELLGATHAEVGASVLAAWSIPPAIVDAVAFHHEPSRTKHLDKLVVVVHAADALLGAATCGANDSPLDLEAIERAGLASHLSSWRDRAAAEAERMVAA